MKKKYLVMVLAALTVLIPMMTLVAQAADPSFGNTYFRNKWIAQDRLVGSPDANRPYTWGPSVPEAPNAIGEPYADSPGGQRLVQYFDKARMELNDPSTGYVSAGLIVRELVTGQRQDGNNTFTQRTPSQTQVAGDSVIVNPNAPTYASFTNLVTLGNADDKSKPSAIGQVINQSVDKSGTVSTINPPEQLAIGAYEGVTGHNIAKPFQDFKYLSGTVTDPNSGQNIQSQPIYTVDPTTNVFGYAISEPYWVQTKVAGVNQTILVQLFQRRVLTYNPALTVNKVEMGNVGQHYYRWRYIETSNPTPTPTPTPTPKPAVPNNYSQAEANYNQPGGGIPAGGSSNIQEYNTGSGVSSSQAVDLNFNNKQGLAVVGTSGNGVHGINLSTLANSFIFKPSGVKFNSDPALFNGTIYIGGDNGVVYAIDEAASGSSVTEKAKTGSVGGAVTGSVAFSPDATQLYYVAAGGLYAVDLGNLSNQKWVVGPGGALTAPVVDANGVIYVGSDNNKLYAYKADGTAITSGFPVTLDGAIKGVRPSLANGNLYVGTDAGTVYKINTANGTTVWSTKVNPVSDINTTIAVAGGYVYVGTNGKALHQLSDTNGAVVNTYTAADKVESSPAVVDGFVYIGDDSGTVYKIDVNNFANTTKLATGAGAYFGNSPVVAGGKVFITASGGKLRVIK